jgi:hypothetical protein
MPPVIHRQRTAAHQRYGTGGRVGLVSWDGMELAVGSG